MTKWITLSIRFDVIVSLLHPISGFAATINESWQPDMGMSAVPGSTPCWSPRPASTHFHSSSVASALATSWGCTGMRPWFGRMLSLLTPFPTGRYSQSLKREGKGDQEEAVAEKRGNKQKDIEWRSNWKHWSGLYAGWPFGVGTGERGTTGTQHCWLGENSKSETPG